jgi:hypothetical protein
VPRWRLVAGVVLIVLGIWSLYEEISIELYRMNADRFDFLPTQETTIIGMVIGSVLLVVGSILFMSGRKYLLSIAKKSSSDS